MAADERDVDPMSPTLMLVGFMAAIGAAAFGMLSLLRLSRGLPAVPRLSRQSVQVTSATSARSARVRACGAAAGAGVVVLLVTRWPLAGVAAMVLVLLGPRMLGGAAAGRRQLATITAVASWTESLRDTSGAAAGLEQAIPATVSAAHPLLRKPLRELAARLEGRVPLPEALARFAADVNDPAADLVVAALTLNARQRAGGLDRILTSLAISSRAELEMRRKVELERRGLRRQAQWIAAAVTAFALLQALFARGWVAPYSSPAGQLVLAVLMAAFIGAFVRMRSLAASQPEPRFLTSPDAVTDIASYKPLPVQKSTAGELR
jgi:tight adherence protein B